MTLAELTARQRAFVEARDWGPFHTPKNLVMALTGEVGELTELFQWLTPDQAAAASTDPVTGPKIADELADVLLYLIRLADVLDVDLIAAANAKIDRNEVRFPVSAGPSGLRRLPTESPE
ncbi:nucleotide pyrophosphohydrolase [Actinokineospora sp.]|uniref:nucleotide pyrophosphohydrolase n=1 Tax=Actinokineospora sp. TaxID=1872133 RepID=UPI0040377F56